MTENRLSALVLSRGSTWNPQPWEPPYLQADPGAPWPTGTASAVFYDTTGSVLLVVDGATTPSAVVFTADPDLTDLIPAGAPFEVYLQYSGKTVQIRHGRVVRREATFMDLPATIVTPAALSFVYTAPTLALGSKWTSISGPRPHAYTNTGGQPNGIGSPTASAIRWFAPLNSDSPKLSVNLLNKTAGKTTVILCSDQRLTKYLAVQFEENAHLIHFCTGSAPNTVAYQGAAITNTVATTPDNYTIGYSQATNTLSVYKGTSLSPLGSFTDTAHAVPHGPGHRYLGLAFNNPAEPGVEVTYWAAKDDV